MSYKLAAENEIEKAVAWLSKFWHKQVHPDYHHAHSINEAVSLLKKYSGKAKIVAGGVDVVGLLKNKVILPHALINIKPLTQYRLIKENPQNLEIGALALVNDIERSALIKEKYPTIHLAARSIASPNIRNMATLGGNLCQEVRCWYYRRSPDTGNTFICRRKSQEGKCYAVEGENQYHAVFGGSPCMAVCASDMATALLALDASLETIDSDGGRTLKIENLYNFLGNNLKTDEIITKIQVPSAWIGAKQQFLKFRIRKTIDFSIVSVAVSIKLKTGLVDDARIAIGGVSWMPIRATQAEQVLIGCPLNERSAIIAARTAVEDATPSNKNEYKIPIVEALLKRALMNEMKESEI